MENKVCRRGTFITVSDNDLTRSSHRYITAIFLPNWGKSLQPTLYLNEEL
jgi:hypothetical protein